uniref:NADH-ubiquinone oxidoreductase chain 4L n=1 Tax=Allobathynella sp. JHS-2017 TaxID=2025385 RepID=A0A7R6D8I6_9CRUS|nr:NADH dehydrogenase subunit 4L [Allobathynella sp. JHS-2017]
MSSMVLLKYVIIIFMASLLMFIINRKQFLNTLLALEFMSLSVLITFMVILNMINNIQFFLIFIALAVSEAALGLAILIRLSRTKGTNKFSLSSMLCI